ncbi:HEPN domain-containing protein [Phascolarctobacterium sp.]|uniref:HEPN domain-containing protein n=1 Tax=Phascolarctobacterium sp. TaxID=2049039 RepID=UPI00386BE562
MSTMYSRSVVMLDQAKTALSKVADDDAYLDAACFETQQAIEFLLKAVLMDNGVPYDKSHDIRYLLSLVDQTGFTFDKHDTLDLLADTITDWEEHSRYGKGVRTSVQTVQRVHNVYKSINDAYLRIQEKNQI